MTPLQLKLLRALADGAIHKSDTFHPSAAGEFSGLAMEGYINIVGYLQFVHIKGTPGLRPVFVGEGYQINGVGQRHLASLDAADAKKSTLH